MMFLDVAKKYFIEFKRNRISIVLLVFFPLFFLFIFSMAFGNSNVDTITTYNVVIVNEDQGIPSVISNSLPNGTIPENWITPGVAENISQILYSATYPGDNAKIPIFDSQEYHNESFESLMENGAVDLIIHFPADFTLMMLNLVFNVYNGGVNVPVPANATVGFFTNPNDFDSPVAKTIAESIISTYVDSVSSGVIPQSVKLDQEIVFQQDDLNIFDFIAAGIFVFATIVSASYFASHLLVDVEKGAIMRIKLSRLHPWEYILGYFVFSYVLMLVQYIVLFAAAIYIFGFSPVGSLLSAYIVLAITSFATYALIFTAASIFTKSDAVGNILGFGSSILGFASGAFFEMPDVILVRNILSFTSGSPHLLLWDLVPWTHAVNAMRAILLFDQSLSDVSGDLFLLSVSSLLWLALSLYLYVKRVFRQED